MESQLISKILETGKQFPEHKLKQLEKDSLELILKLREEYGNE